VIKTKLVPLVRCQKSRTPVVRTTSPKALSRMTHAFCIRNAFRTCTQHYLSLAARVKAGLGVDDSPAHDRLGLLSPRFCAIVPGRCPCWNRFNQERKEGLSPPLLVDCPVAEPQQRKGLPFVPARLLSFCGTRSRAHLHIGDDVNIPGENRMEP
jgi:hypothetical protein